MASIMRGAWLDRYGIRPNCLGLGGPPLLGLGVRPPRSCSLLWLIVNSHAESASMLRSITHTSAPHYFIPRSLELSAVDCTTAHE